MGLGENLRLKLSTDRQPCTAPKKIMGKRITSLERGGFKGGHGKHLPCPFAVGSGDNRSMDLNETLLMEKTMNGKAEDTPYPRDCTKSIGPGAKVRN